MTKKKKFETLLEETEFLSKKIAMCPNDASTSFRKTKLISLLWAIDIIVNSDPELFVEIQKKIHEKKYNPHHPNARKYSGDSV